MSVTIQQEEGNVRVLRITGLLRKAEMDSVFATEAQEWGPTTRVRVLVMVEGFEGFERGANWEDMTFFEKYGDQVDKIAIVVDPRWETDLLMFVGAGFRRGAVKFFPANQLALARAWLG